MLGEAGRYRRQQGGTGGSREVQEAAGRYVGQRGGKRDSRGRYSEKRGGIRGSRAV